MLPSWIGVWELGLLVLVVIALIWGATVSPFFLTADNFAITVARSTGIGLMVLPMMWLMIAGEIDLSVASIFGLTGVIFGLCIESGFGLTGSFVLAMAAGGLAGVVNAVFSVVIGLPSLIVTVGTLSVYRGLAFVLLENRSISTFPDGFTQFTQDNIGNTSIPYTFVVFLVIAAISGLLLQRGVVGRKAYAIGSSPDVSRFSGIRVKWIKAWLFIVSGLVSALAGILFSGYVSSARATNGLGLELTVIAIVLIGGASIYGGEGKFLGVLLSLVLVTIITSVMTLQFITTDIQNMVIGLLMAGAVVVPSIAARTLDWRKSRQRSR
jgi:rhamnose transport system permease protein